MADEQREQERLRYSERHLLDACKRGESPDPGKVIEVVRRLGRTRQRADEASLLAARVEELERAIGKHVIAIRKALDECEWGDDFDAEVATHISSLARSLSTEFDQSGSEEA